MIMVEMMNYEGEKKPEKYLGTDFKRPDDRYCNARTLYRCTYQSMRENPGTSTSYIPHLPRCALDKA